MAVVVEVVLDFHDSGASRAGLVEVVHTAQDLMEDPLVGKVLELAAVAVVWARASCSMVCGPGRLLSECLVVDKRLQWSEARSVGCEVDYNLDKLVWQIASPLLAEQAGLLQAHSLSMGPCLHSPHRQSHLECSCCLLSKVRLMSGGELVENS